MQSLNVGEDSTRALNYYSSLQRDESLTEEEKQLSLIEFFRNKHYIPKECLRAVRTDLEPIVSNERAVRSFPFLNAAMLRSTQVALVHHCAEFNCFYIDMNS